ncbi:MAG TPA: NAD(+) synthase [Bacteroidota bacterium]|nr:NAD(+) synthase [Bacteroidota bacterium]
MLTSSDVLMVDAEREIEKIAQTIRTTVRQTVRRRGAVVGVSGGIDSAVCAALCVRAFGSAHVLALLMPERDSSETSRRLGRQLAERFQIPCVEEDITPVLEGAGCYRRQLEAIRHLFPQYGEGWKNKIVLPSILDGDRLNVSRLTVQTPQGEYCTERLSMEDYLQLVAATNFKQRIRAMMEYYHADRLNYAVCGTPNRLEYDQGFFVKGGDGLADFKPIAHLYKTQVYQLARALGVPDEIVSRTPTTDTYSLEQTQEEFYFALPYDKMDLCLYSYNNNITPDDAAAELGLRPEQVERIYKDIESKRRATLSLHLPALTMEPVEPICALIDDVKKGS